jgi:uncharacterized phage protein (TIGR01671 family)
MNREIKFRGKHLNENEWYHGSLIVEDENNCTIVGNDFGEVPVIPETVCQFTGLLDKNGKEIYEGDIVTAELFNKQLVFVIREKQACWYAEHKEPIWSYALTNILSRHTDCKVIGNIHDNPELIKEK